MENLEVDDVVKVNCRVGSLEINHAIVHLLGIVNCRVGSLENIGMG